MAEDALSDTEFRALIRELHKLNDRNPSLAYERSGPAREYAEAEGSFFSRALFEVAMAPSEMIRRGETQVRQEIISLLDGSYASRMAHELVPLVRLAISDLLYRNGMFRLGFYHATEALKATTPETPDWIQVRLILQISRLNESSLSFFESLYQLENLQLVKDFQNWIHPVELELRKSESFLRGGNSKNRDLALKEASDLMKEGLDPELVGWYWLQRASISLVEGRPDLALEELVQAKNRLENGTSLPLMGDLLLLEAAIFDHSGENVDNVQDLLDKAQDLYIRSGFPGRYADRLIRHVRAPFKRRIDEVSGVFLSDLEQFSFDGTRLIHFSEGLHASSELLRRAGREKESLNKLFESRRYLAHFNHRIERRQTQWAKHVYQRLGFVSDSRHAAIYYYGLLTLLIFLVLALFLSLKIRTQRHMNLRMADSVDKARAAEQAAEASSRLKSQFLANVSHELKTPMSGLVGMASLLDESISDPVQRKYLGTIQTCSRNLLVLINDLLDLGRIESGKLEIDRKPFVVREVVGHCLELAEASASRRGLEMESVVEPAVPTELVGDPLRISQVLNNLIHNAIKYTPEGTVCLKVDYEESSEAPGMLLIHVEDTGIGIKAADLHTLFEPFSRVEGTNVAEMDGTGLGLAICRKLVELMNGSISVNSEPEKGSAFTVRLPVTRPES